MVFVGCGGGLTQGRLGGVSMVTRIIVPGWVYGLCPPRSRPFSPLLFRSWTILVVVPTPVRALFSPSSSDTSAFPTPLPGKELRFPFRWEGCSPVEHEEEKEREQGSRVISWCIGIASLKGKLEN